MKVPTLSLVRAARILSVLGPVSVLHAEDPTFSLGATVDNFQLGSGFACLGDLDGDGTADLALADQSCRVDGQSGSGIVHVVSGADGSILRSHVGVPARLQYFGLALAGFDADGDGVTDLAVGAPGQADGSGFGAGSVWVCSGADGSVLYQVIGPAASQYGSALALAGDRDGDGTEDLFVGAPNASGGVGAVFVQSGATGDLLATIPSEASFSGFGSALASLPDADGDGLPELAVAAPGYRVSGSEVGRVTLVRSAGGGIFAGINGAGFLNRLGQSLATVADHDRDGMADLLVGSYSGGTLRLVSGLDLSLLADLSQPNFPPYQPLQAGGGLDYDGDGTGDWLVGSTGFGTGGVRILSGSDRSTLFTYDSTQTFTGLGASVRVLPGFGFAAGAIYQMDPVTGGRGIAHFWQHGSAPTPPDTDGDGIPDDLDEHPDSVTDPTVLLFGDDSGVENRLDEHGTTLADRLAELPDPEDLGNDGRYVSLLGKTLQELEEGGWITRDESKQLHRTAVLALADEPSPKAKGR